jgi:multicomponent Na+:H+ antiporter subunit E
MLKIRAVLFVLSFLTWVLLSGSLDPEHCIIGVVVGIFISLTTSDLFKNKPYVFKNLPRYLWFFYYIPLFTWECIKSNIDGAYRVIHPDVPLKPGIVKVRTTLKSEAALTFLANSLTLKPGTMTVDVDKEKGFLYVHWVDVETQDVGEATRRIVYKFERILKRIFE